MKEDNEPLRVLLSKNIKRYRSNFRYTQEKLAEKAGISAQSLNDIEGCRRWLSSKTMTKLAKALNIAEFQLIFPENSEKEENDIKSSLKSLISLKDSVIYNIDIQFEKAMETGDFN
jgi:transcriptional regulator with XRE-family HTH domain